MLYLTFRNQDNSYALSFFQGISENRVLLSAKPGDLGYSELLGLQQAINDSFQATIDLIMSELNQIEA